MSGRTQDDAATIIHLRCVKWESVAVLLVLNTVGLYLVQNKAVTFFG